MRPHSALRPLLAAVAFATVARAAEPIVPPFGLFWHEPQDRIERKVTNTKARIVERRREVDGREGVHIEGIQQAGLKRTVFYFRRGELCGVELQYQPDNWDQRRYDEFLGQMRQALERRFGQGQLISRKTEEKEAVNQTLVGYKWNQNNASIELFYFSANNDQHVFRTLSVHYKVE